MSMQRSVQTLIVRPSKMAVRNMQNTASVPKPLYIPKAVNLEKPKPMISYFLAGGSVTALAGYVATR
jgi:hypothetical protein